MNSKIQIKIDESKIKIIKKYLSTFPFVDNIFISDEFQILSEFPEFFVNDRTIYSAAIISDIEDLPTINKGGIVFYFGTNDIANDFISKNFTQIDTLTDELKVYCNSGVVDIILPTWNAYDYVVDCVNSIYKHTKNVPIRLILVDDQSTEKNISEFFNKTKRDVDIYHLNEVNVGFVKTCNYGLKLSEENDVVLQNTDTVVTKNWLSNMIKRSYQDPRVGICNPISNNASIYSIKEFEKANLSADDIAQAIQENSRDMVIEVPVAVGFSFFVKREVLNKVGFLDEIFGRGYGEENDMCLKAYLAGYKSIIIDDSFVYHKGSISMVLSGDMKKNHPEEISTKPEHEKILTERYPFFHKLINDESFQNNLQNFLQVVKFNCFSKLSESRKKVMYLLHSDPFVFVGGTEIHVLDLSKKISAEFSVYILFPNKDKFNIYEYFNGVFVNTYSFKKSIEYPEYTLHENSIKNLYSQILSLFDIDILHIHHFKNNTLDPVNAAKELEIPVMYTMHDYYSVDPNHNLSFKLINGTYNEDFVPSPEYYSKFTNQMSFDINTWHSSMLLAMKKCKLLLAPSERVKTEVQKVYNIKNIEVKSIPMWIAEKEIQDPKKLTDFNKRLCFLGGVNTEIKGKYLIEKIVPELIKKGFEIHFLGVNNQKWNLPTSNKIIFHGNYERKDVVNKLHAINPKFVLILSVVHESFSYTLSESFKAGIPVICTPMGAVAERVKKSHFGYILKSLIAEEIIKEISEIVENKFDVLVSDIVDNDGYIETLANLYNVNAASRSENVRSKQDSTFNYIHYATEKFGVNKYPINSRQLRILKIYNKFENVILGNRHIRKLITNSKLKNLLKNI